MGFGITTDRTIAALSVAATLLVGWITLNATVDMAAWGGIPPKSLEANYIGPTDPLSDLSPRDAAVEVRVLSDGKPVRKLRVVQATLENTGATPILPADMVEPLSIRAEKNWKIVGIANQPLLKETAPQLKWTRVDDGVFKSEPALINPGDMVWATVYLSWTGEGEPPPTTDQAVSWLARIANLRGIANDKNTLEESIRRSGPIEVHLWGWGVPFTLASFAIYCWLTVLLLARFGLMRPDSRAGLAAVPLTSLLNIAAAEAGATYVFGINPIITVPTSHWANLPPIFANSAMIVGLLIMAKGRPSLERADRIE
ncbi:hypothetical protein EQZ23_06995 [Sphingomonas sp. UV9]|uniref:hypothetical protein n=1 Tax=Sphingomonas sp. UV9 TaxID=1851410 RepID=UPI000FFBF399|nr:hypothetical protein [Sphingomonas sp. UV9]RXD04879.1 hypothetical protein EQZ23_06995 [Sphingomonas sp. UV9]